MYRLLLWKDHWVARISHTTWCTPRARPSNVELRLVRTTVGMHRDEDYVRLMPPRVGVRQHQASPSRVIGVPRGVLYEDNLIWDNLRGDAINRAEKKVTENC